MHSRNDMKSRGVALVLFFAITVAFALGAASGLLPENSPIGRASAVPGVMQCLACHGKAGQGFPDDRALACGSHSASSAHPAYNGDCEDFLAFFAAMRLRDSFEARYLGNPDNRLIAAERLARRYYCFQCHGELGQGGFPNQGALKGYVPGYFGDDFRLLTDGGSRLAVRRWISNGVDPDLLARFITGPIAAFFIERQAIRMPDFTSLPDDELALLVDYVITLNGFGPMGRAALREYERRAR